MGWWLRYQISESLTQAFFDILNYWLCSLSSTTCYIATGVGHKLICCPLPVASANMVSLCPTNDILQHNQKTSQVWFISPITSVVISCPLWICVTNHPILVSQKPSTYIWGRYECEIKDYDLPEERACQVIQYHSRQALLGLTRPPPAISNYLLVGLQGDKHKHKIQGTTPIIYYFAEFAWKGGTTLQTESLM